MAIGEKDQSVLKALAVAREQHKELADLLNFYYDLYKVQFEAKTELPEPEARDDLAMHWRLEGSIPQLTFDQLRLEPEYFARLVAQVSEVLLRHNPGWEMDQEGWVSTELVALAQEVFENWHTLTAPRPDAKGEESGESWSVHPKALAVGFAMAPYLQRASDAILPCLDLTLWMQGHCPICGGRPNFALLEEGSGARKLMCSRCASLWPYARLGCPFCNTEERPVHYSSEDSFHRLYVCHACKRYLKTVDLREARHVVHPMVERLLTIGMDLTARQEGYEG